jgi:hypothetical protein
LLPVFHVSLTRDAALSTNLENRVKRVPARFEPINLMHSHGLG